MTTEHVSVPRELAEACEMALRERGYLGDANDMQAILSRAPPSDELQGAFAECYISTTGLETLRTPGAGIATVGRAKTDYSHIPLFLQPQPSTPRMVTDDDVERALIAYYGRGIYAKWENFDEFAKASQREYMRAALESFATSLPAAIPTGYVVVPESATDVMLEALEETMCVTNKGALLNPCACWDAMLAAAPQAGERG